MATYRLRVHRVRRGHKIKLGPNDRIIHVEPVKVRVDKAEDTVYRIAVLEEVK